MPGFQDAWKGCLPIFKSSKDSGYSSGEDSDTTHGHASRKMYKPNDTYKRIKTLETGDEGSCTVVKSATTGKLLVVKSIEIKKNRSVNGEKVGRRKPLPNEARMLERLRPHPNIIHFFGKEQSCAFRGWHLLFMEYCTGGDLLEQLRKFQDMKIPTPEIFTLLVFIGLAQALACIHHGLRHEKSTTYHKDAGHISMIHGDIKPDNVFLRWRNSNTTGLPDVVLADFGMAQLACESWGITGTPTYEAPEVKAITDLRESDPKEYTRRKNAPGIMSTKSDVYGLGLVLYLMVKDGKQFESGADPMIVELPERYQDVTGLLAALCWCLQPDPELRPECTAALDNGLLHAVDTFEKKRDAMCKTTGVLERSIWNVTKLE